MWCGYQKLGNHFYSTVCGFFIDAAVLFFRANFRSMDVIVRKFVDLFVTARIGRW